MLPTPPRGTTATLTVTVTPAMTARVGGDVIHAVYGTVALVTHIEEVCRSLLRPLLEDGEEGVGAEIAARHDAPVPVGQQVTLVATVSDAGPRHLTCTVVATASGEQVATGSFQQRVVPLAQFRAAVEARAAADVGAEHDAGG